MCVTVKKEIEMKKTLLFFTLFTLLLVLAACGGASNSGDTASASTSLSLQDELLIGTFKLEDTSLAVSSDQVSQLIPLWETMQSLAASGTTATEEINAVITQIKSTMTSQQINAITAMGLTQQDLTTVMSENGLTSKSSSAGSTPEPSSIQGPLGDTSAGGAGNPGAGIPGGAADPSGTGSGQSLSQVQVPSSQTDSSQSQGSSDQASTSLLSALIELLQKKVQS
jgi:hypothetical protein